MSVEDDNEPKRETDLSADRDFDDLQSGLHGLLFETSPYGNLDAIVQHDGRSVYFYLNGQEPFGTRACWVRNLVEAPYVLNQRDLEQGIPPMMPRTHCQSKAGCELPVAESLQVVWLEEGNGAALFENEDLISVIPPWSDVDGFHGYAAECIAESPLAWPLVESPQLIRRIENAREFWHSCASESTHPFARLQPQLMDAWREQFGNEKQYYSLDGGRFPPCGAALFNDRESSTLVSVGMSFRPQPNVEMSVEHPREIRRVELAIKLPPAVADSELMSLLEQFSGLTRFPWMSFTWFGHQHTLQMNSIEPIFGPGIESVELFEDRRLKPASGIRMPEFRGDPIQLLWLKPN